MSWFTKFEDDQVEYDYLTYKIQVEGRYYIRRSEPYFKRLFKIYNYWAGRFYGRDLWLKNNEALPLDLQVQIADYIAPRGEVEDYFPNPVTIYERVLGGQS